jgi:hypothetical protein
VTRLFAASGVGCNEGFGFSRVGFCLIRARRASRAARALSLLGSIILLLQKWIAFPIQDGCRKFRIRYAPPEILPEQTPTAVSRAGRENWGARISHPENETENPNSGMLPRIASQTFEM